MKFPKIVADTYNDRVEVDHSADRVYLNDTVVRAAGSNLTADFAYTPEQARRLAKALRKAAKAAEQ